jgi:hypothetical protein
MMLIDTVSKDVPELYLEYLAEIVMEGYSKSGEICAKHFARKSVRENAIPWNRRAFIEQSLLHVPDILVGDAVVQEIRNAFWWHVEVTIGGVVIAQATAPDVDASIRPSNFKLHLAGQTQKRMFCDVEQDSAAPKLFAALTHGPRRGEPEYPAFVAIKVPRLGDDGTIVGYYDGAIDLMDRFPHFFSPVATSDAQTSPGVEPEAEESIEDTAFPELLAEDETGE